MSWSGSVSQPNWAGHDNAGGSDVGDLYIVPDPPTITQNPSIGLEGRNEVSLPTKYLDLQVANLTATNIDAEDMTTTNLTADNITATNINGNPNFDASNWSLFRAISNVQGTLGIFSVPLFSILDFLNITCTNNIQSTGGNITAALSVVAGTNCTAPLGSFPTITSTDIEVSSLAQIGDVNIYGVNKLAGDNALFVSGGTTLTGGGVIHGVVIGALQVAGIDTVRIDVLPVGMLLTSATFITITATGAVAVSSGGVLSLAGGSHIEYNSDQHYFKNTSAGNDFTDILVGNIYPALNGSAPLRINGGGSGRGVVLADVNSMTMTTQLAGINAWSNPTFYAVGSKVRLAGPPPTYYNALVYNRETPPNLPIQNWVGGTPYDVNVIVFSAGLVYRCLNYVSSFTPPATDPTNWQSLGFTTNAITNIWAVYSPSVANMTGDDVSNMTIGKITAPVDFVRLNASGGLFTANTTSGLVGFNHVDLVAQTGSDATIYFKDSDGVLQSKIFIDNTAKRLTIQSDNGLTINNTGLTTTDFSAGVVENVKTLTLTSTLFPLWNVATSYANDAEVSYQDGNWVSHFAGNLGNKPLATLDDWVSGDAYDVGNVRYYAPNAYLCILAVPIGTTTPPVAGANWSVFQLGNNGDDVWFPFTAPVLSSIVGDRVSTLQIGQIACVGDVGSYLEITQDVGNPQNGIVQSAGALGFIGDQGVQIASANNDVDIISITGDIQLLADTGGVVINGKVLVGIESENGDVLIIGNNDVNITATTGDALLTSTAGGIILTSDLATSITSSANAITLSSQEATSITSTANAVNLTGFLGVNINSPDAISLTSSTSDVNMTTTTGSTNITSGGEISLEATGGNIRIHSTTADLALQGQTVSITTPAGGNVAINTYYPLLTIYKNATIGSAISRAANTAEIQVYQQTMTLKANTQYNVNMSYSLLTENAGTATPNNNYYIIYRIHGGTSPLTTANLYSVSQIFNSTQIANGVSLSFMTGSLTTYTGRFYIRNQHATIALTIANLQASVIEVF